MSDVHTPMTLIEIRPHRWGWKVFELRASNLFSRRSVRQSIMRRIAHGFAPVRFGFWIQVAKSNAAYFFSSTITVWISAFPVFSTASDSASRHHASPAFLFIAIVFPSDPVSLPMAGVIA